jgi:hypothetical protein
MSQHEDEFESSNGYATDETSVKFNQEEAVPYRDEGRRINAGLKSRTD